MNLIEDLIEFLLEPNYVVIDLKVNTPTLLFPDLTVPKIKKKTTITFDISKVSKSLISPFLIFISCEGNRAPPKLKTFMNLLNRF